MNIDNIEDIFRNSNDSNELFDAFHSALETELKDIELYKILLGNPTLSEDEICMYVEKIASVIPQKAFEIFNWSGGLFEIKSPRIESAEKSLQYYAKAANIEPNNFLPYKNSINLYNYDFDISLNKHIIKFIETGIPVVKRKSILYKVLADHFKRIGDFEKSKSCESLAQKSAERE